MTTIRLAILSGLLVFCLAALGTGAAWFYSSGKAAAEAAVERANRKAGDKADEAERRVLDCPDGKWNREKRECLK